jgi:hypothetical protein
MNAGVFSIFGYNILSSLAWVVVIMLFLRFLPKGRLFLYLYILTFAVYGVAYGYVVQNAGLYTFQPWYYPLGSFLIHLIYFAAAAWIFNKTSSIAGADY